MARNKIGEAYVEVSADASGLRAELDAAQTKTEQFAGESKKSTKSLGQAFTDLQGVVSKILIPTAIVGSVASLVNQFRAGIEEARKFRMEVEAYRRGVIEAAAQSAIALRSQSELEAEILELRKQQRQEEAQLQEQLEERIRSTSALREQWDNLRGLFTDEPVTLDEKVAELREEIARTEQAYRQQEQALRQQIEQRMRLRRTLIEEEIKAEDAARLERQAADDRDLQARERKLIDAARMRTEIELAEIDRRIAEELKREDEKAAELLRRRREQIEQELRDQTAAIRRVTDELAKAIRDSVKNALVDAFDQFRAEQGNVFESITDLRDSIDWLRSSGRLGR